MCAYIHCKIFPFQKGYNPRLVSNLLCVFECLQDIVPEDDFLLRLRIGVGVNMVYLVGCGEGNSVGWDTLVDCSKSLDVVQRIVALCHSTIVVCMAYVGVGGENKKLLDVWRVLCERERDCVDCDDDT